MDNKEFEKRIKWEIKHHYKWRRLIDKMSCFPYKKHNLLHTFDIPIFTKLINKLYAIDNNIIYWIINGHSYKESDI